MRNSMGVHSFLVESMDAIKSCIGRKKSIDDWHTMMADMRLASLEFFAIKMEAKEVEDLTIPMFSYAKHENNKLQLSRTVLWDFGNIYAGMLTFFTTVYEEIHDVNVGYIMAKDRKAANKFLADYEKAVWESNRKCPCTLDYHGARISGLRTRKWNEIFLPDGMVEQIRVEVETFFANREEYAAHNLPWKRGIMLAGRPGNGKTAIAEAITTNSTVPVVYCAVDSNNMFSILDGLKATIEKNAPCIVIIEDADVLGSSAETRSAFLNMLDGLFSTMGVLTIASTNSPERLDEAMLRRPSRFDSFYVIPGPTAAEMKQLLRHKFGRHTKRIPDSFLDSFCPKMKGFSAAFVQEIAACALLDSLNRKEPLSEKHLLDALKKVGKHISQATSAAENGVLPSNKGDIGFS